MERKREGKRKKKTGRDGEHEPSSFSSLLPHPGQDTNADSLGDGAVITSAAKRLYAAIPLAGKMMDLRLTLQVTGSNEVCTCRCLQVDMKGGIW